MQVVLLWPTLEQSPRRWLLVTEEMKVKTTFSIADWHKGCSVMDRAR